MVVVYLVFCVNQNLLFTEKTSHSLRKCHFLDKKFHIMTQQQTPTQLAQTFPRKTEDLTTASILTASNTPMLNLGPSSSVPVQSTTSATIPSTSGGGAAANITDKNDPKMVEQSVAKLKQFLKKLVKLAEGRKKEVQDQVQSHVQRLLVSSYRTKCTSIYVLLI